MYLYSAYGLGIRSAMPIPELLSVDKASDVLIEYGSLRRPHPDEMYDYCIVQVERDTIYLFMEEVGAVQVEAGRKIIVDPLPGAEERGFRFFVTGMAMGLLLHQRNVFTLHASAVAIEGKAVAFVGVKRMGKSTTAAALFQRGYPLVTDDLLVLDLNGPQGGVTVIPGYPHLKLWPESLAATFGDNPETLTKVHPEATKRVRFTTSGFTQESLPLQCIYLLEANEMDDQVTIMPLAPQEACIELIRHSYAVRILNAHGSTPAHLQQCAAVIERVPIRRLSRPHSLSSLPGLIECVEADAAQVYPGPLRTAAISHRDVTA